MRIKVMSAAEEIRNNHKKRTPFSVFIKSFCAKKKNTKIYHNLAMRYLKEMIGMVLLTEVINIQARLIRRITVIGCLMKSMLPNPS